MNQLVVVKIGGNIIDDAVQLCSFLKSFAAIEGYKILVHGGGKLATDMGNRLNIESQYVNGRRVTDLQTLELVTMVYGGSINKNIVAQLQSMHSNAIGLTGADGNIITATRRAVKEVDYGYVGDVKEAGVNASAIQRLLGAGFIPVLAPLTHDSTGQMLNTNADTIAQEVAKAMSKLVPVQLVYCFDKKGVLADAMDETSVISSIDSNSFEQLKADKIISDGMIPKLDNAFAALANGVNNVILGHAEDMAELIKGTAGTRIA